MTHPRIIVFEGVDGSGKDTQYRLFEEFLNEKGIKYNPVREPGTTEVGKKLREYLLKDKRINFDPVQEAVFFNASRLSMFVEEVNSSLEKGELVLFNRCFYSTIVYQVRAPIIAKEKDPDYKSISKKESKLIEDMTLGIVKNYHPDLTYIFDLPLKHALRRLGKSKDKIESRKNSYLEGVIEAYQELPKRFKDCVIIDATKEIDEIQKEIREIYSKKFRKINFKD